MKELMQVKKSDYIAVADKPLLQGGEIKKLTAKQFQEQFGWEYSEGIFIRNDIPTNKLAQTQENIVSDVPVENLKKQLKNRLEAPLEDLVICKINDDVGYGVFTNKKISKGTLICIYSGEIIFSEAQQSSSLGYTLKFHNTTFGVCPTQFRGIGSFMQHLPTNPRILNIKIMLELLHTYGQNISEEVLRLTDELYNINFKAQEIRDNLATENINHDFLLYQGCPVIAFVARRDIQPGEQLGYNYSYLYWQADKRVPEFFDIKGSIIPSEVYERTFGILFFQDFTYGGDLLSLIPKAQESGMVTLHQDGKDYAVSSEELRKELIRVHAVSNSFSASNKSTFSNVNMAKVKSSPENTLDFFNVWQTHDINQALRRAAALKSRQEMELLFQYKNLNIDSQDNNPKTGYTALHIAVLKNKVDNTYSLIEHNANYNIADKQGKTAIDYIIDKDNQELLTFLKQYILKKYDTTDITKAFRAAADKGDKESLKVLLTFDVDVNQPGPTSGQTALHRAAWRGHEECVKFLLEVCAHPNPKDSYGKTPLEYAPNNNIAELFKSASSINNSSLEFS